MHGFQVLLFMKNSLIHFIHFVIAGLYAASCRDALLFRLIKKIQVNSRIKVRLNKQEMDCNKYFGWIYHCLILQIQLKKHQMPKDNHVSTLTFHIKHTSYFGYWVDSVQYTPLVFIRPVAAADSHTGWELYLLHPWQWGYFCLWDKSGKIKGCICLPKLLLCKSMCLYFCTLKITVI